MQESEPPVSYSAAARRVSRIRQTAPELRGGCPQSAARSRTRPKPNPGLKPCSFSARINRINTALGCVQATFYSTRVTPLLPATSMWRACSILWEAHCGRLLDNCASPSSMRVIIVSIRHDHCAFSRWLPTSALFTAIICLAQLQAVIATQQQCTHSVSCQ